MSLTSIFAVIVLLFVWRGYRKGFVGAITPLLSMAVAYPAAIFLTGPFANFLAANTPLQGLLVYLIASITIFTIASLVVALPLQRYAHRKPEDTDEEQEEANGRSRLGGALVGLCVGTVSGLLTLYAIGVIRPPPPGTVPSRAESFLMAGARLMVGAATDIAANFVFDDATTAEITKAFAADPQRMLAHVRDAMASSGQMTALMDDPEVSAMVQSNDVDALMRIPQFQELVANEHIQALTATTGENDTQATAETLVSTWAKIHKVRSDPEFAALVADPELQQQLQTRDMALMTNPKFAKLAKLVFAGEQPAD